jgi:hypothetical protein
MLILIFCERKILLNGWLILTDKFKKTGANEEKKRSPVELMMTDAPAHVVRCSPKDVFSSGVVKFSGIL